MFGSVLVNAAQDLVNAAPPVTSSAGQAKEAKKTAVKRWPRDRSLSH